MTIVWRSFLLATTAVPGVLSAQIAPDIETDSDPADARTFVVTGTRSADPLPADRIGSSVTVLDETMLERRQVRQVSDVLRDVPGIAVGHVSGQTQIRIRGAEANHTLVLIDGIEVSDPFVGEFDFSGLIADEAARIEVLRGQQSAIYGSDAIGGVIQYITLTGREAPGISGRIVRTRRLSVASMVPSSLKAARLCTDGARGSEGCDPARRRRTAAASPASAPAVVSQSMHGSVTLMPCVRCASATVRSPECSRGR